MITSDLYGPGSYGIWPRLNDNGQRADGRPEGTVMRVWFCGRSRLYGKLNRRPCAHRTRQEARDCTGENSDE